ncbi:hypothetical protein N8515_00750 [bacterium]|nr:hypothetical protein [bacterium]
MKRTKSNLLAILDLIAIAGIILDWLPKTLFPGIAVMPTGTMLLAAPSIALGFIWRAVFLKQPVNKWGLVFVVILFIGLLPYNGDILQLKSYLGRYGVNALFFLYFLYRRSLFDHRRILIFSLVLTSLIPLLQYLGSIGLVQSYIEQEQLGSIRRYTGITPSSLGLYLSVIPATLGGILVIRFGGIKPFFNCVCSVILYIAGLYVVFSTAQRSALLAHGLCSGLAIIVLLKYSRRTYTTSFRNLIVVVGVFSIPTWTFAQGAYSLLSERVSSTTTDVSALSRFDMILVFAEDSTKHPSLLGPGLERFIMLHGQSPHNVFGELYYVGGWLLLASSLAGIFYSFIQWVRASIRPKKREEAMIFWIYTILLIGISVHCLFHNSLGVRALPLFVGLAMSVFRTLGGRRC